MDVHSTTFSLHCLGADLLAEDHALGSWKVAASVRNVLDVISKLKEKLDGDLDIECGYEAGCLGFSLYNELQDAGVECVVMASTTMLSPQRRRIKTDACDAEMIAQCLAHGEYQPVHVPSERDLDVKRYIRMRDDHKLDLKRKMQQISSCCILEGLKYNRTKWTKGPLEWLQKLKMDEADRETPDEYLQTYNYPCDRLEAMDERIAEFQASEPYIEQANKLQCFIGVKELTAMKCITETSDFNRFPAAGAYAGYVGLGPGEHSSGESLHRTGITKAGSGVLRTVSVAAAKSACKGKTEIKGAVRRRSGQECLSEGQTLGNMAQRTALPRIHCPRIFSAQAGYIRHCPGKTG